MCVTGKPMRSLWTEEVFVFGSEQRTKEMCIVLIILIPLVTWKKVTPYAILILHSYQHKMMIIFHGEMGFKKKKNHWKTK